MDIIELSTHATLALAEAATRAVAQGRTFRVSTGITPNHGAYVKFKIGEDMWSPPFYEV